MLAQLSPSRRTGSHRLDSRRLAGHRSRFGNRTGCVISPKTVSLSRVPAKRRAVLCNPSPQAGDPRDSFSAAYRIGLSDCQRKFRTQNRAACITLNWLALHIAFGCGLNKTPQTIRSSRPAECCFRLLCLSITNKTRSQSSSHRSTRWRRLIFTPLMSGSSMTDHAMSLGSRQSHSSRNFIPMCMAEAAAQLWQSSCAIGRL